MVGCALVFSGPWVGRGHCNASVSESHGQSCNVSSQGLQRQLRCVSHPKPIPSCLNGIPDYPYLCYWCVMRSEDRKSYRRDNVAGLAEATLCPLQPSHLSASLYTRYSPSFPVPCRDLCMMQQQLQQVIFQSNEERNENRWAVCEEMSCAPKTQQIIKSFFLVCNTVSQSTLAYTKRLWRWERGKTTPWYTLLQ